MVSRRTLAVVGLVALVALAGCGMTGSGSDGGSAGGYDAATELAANDRPQATGEPTEAPSDGSGGGSADGGDGDVNIDDRAIIRTGTVHVEVDDYESAQTELTSTVESYGGYVSDSRQDRREIDNETWVRGELVLRVPSEDFDAFLNDTRALGEVQSVEVNSRDVTGQLVDIEARLENLRAERDRLRELYDQANTTEDVLAVQRELSDVQGEIERLEARQQSLEDQVAYSTLTVRLEEPRPTPNRVAPDRWYDTPVLSAFMQSVDGVVVVARATVVAFAFALPYFLAFALPVLVVGGVLWRATRGYRSGE
ncbi:DUF4349 domain-containing protein [Halobellus salinisoli]|uniref:DUF4349 domain-containing protein n=1 Tax=Halobellus salinisoli TaxID=3108500 RepID=UPI00300B7870